MRLKPATVMLSLLCFGIGQAEAQDATTRLQPLLGAIAQRLAIADQVALSKWDSKTSVDDPTRESQEIAAEIADGTPYGLVPSDISRFYEAQIEANKLVQYGLLTRWRFVNTAPPHAPINLTGVIRPELDALDTTILKELAADQDIMAAPACALIVARVTTIGEYAGGLVHDELHRTALMRAMSGFCRVY